jgi:type II secretory pathway predicted ATPase ExeA
MQFERQPFQSQVDTAFFFSDGSRRFVVDEIKRALLEGVPLLTLTGTEGSGKTMICRMVERELEGEKFLVLFIDQSVESFDDVVGLTAESIGLVNEETDSKTRIIQVADALQEEPKRLVIILDGAEKMYLATLERIRRMLDEVNKERVVIQLLFSGRPLFLVNFKKLGIVSFKEIEERHFSLDPLDAEATKAYLNQCVDLAAGIKLEYFSADVAQAIAHEARGNFSLINQLADGYIKTGRIAKSSEIRIPEDLDDGLEAADTPDFRSRLSARLNQVDLDFLKVPQIRARYYLLGGAVLLVALLISLYGTDSGTDRGEPPETPPVPVLELDKAEPLETPPPLIESETRQAEKIEPVEEELEQKQAEVQQADAKVLERPKKQTPEKRPEPPAEKQTPRPAEQIAEPAAGQTDFGITPESQEIAKSPAEATKEAQSQIAEAIKTRDEVFPSETHRDQPEISDNQQVGQPAQAEQPERLAEEPVKSQEVVLERLDAPIVEQEEIGKITAFEQQPSAEQDAGPAVALSESAVGTEAEVVENAAEPAPTAAPVVVIDQQPSTEQDTGPAVALSESAADTEAEVVENAAEPAPTAAPLVVSQQKQKRQPEAPGVITLEGDAKKLPAEVPEKNTPAEQPVAEQQVAKKQIPEKKTLPAVAPESVPLSEALVPKTVPGPSPVQLPQAQPFSEEQQVAKAKAETQRAPEVGPASKQAEAVINVSSFYAERLAAGARWLVGAGRDKYTVQLMVLRSDEAEGNLKEMLTSSNYKDFSKRLYILKRAGTPQMVMLFFGEFDTQVQAYQARNELPDSLRTLNPYAISIKDAVEKAKSGR